MKTTDPEPNTGRPGTVTPGGPAAATDETRLVGADRVLAVLKELASHPDGAGLDQLTRAIGSPKPTVHRALRSLRRAGLADQDDTGRYVLGDEFLRLAFAHHEVRPEHVRIRPALEALAVEFGETTHYAVLDGRDVVYRAKVDPPVGAVRLTSTIGGRNPAHSTAVGKLLLAHRLRTRADVAGWSRGHELVERTSRTRCTVDAIHAELQLARSRCFATDDQENEVGVNCLAVPVFSTSSEVPSGAVSVSALAYRTPLRNLVDAVGEIRAMLGPVADTPR
ncbi:IclR family transcriptional regulator [Pseudonocardia nematodicida]|uniref:IclR family transcriptional regulator n=1 Tax=Pseudonocardia nematodicida TaxID=1206997 RepID=A0ABV1KE78_9PSEU